MCVNTNYFALLKRLFEEHTPYCWKIHAYFTIIVKKLQSGLWLSHLVLEL
jgi:hypothetical protein